MKMLNIIPKKGLTINKTKTTNKLIAKSVDSSLLSSVCEYISEISSIICLKPGLYKNGKESPYLKVSAFMF